MSHDKHYPPGTLNKPFETPSRVFLTALKTPGSDIAYQTVVISYIGVRYDHTPDPVFLTTLEAVELELISIPESSHATFLVTAYHESDPKSDLMEFTHTKYYELQMPAKPASDFLTRAETAGYFALVINTDLYMFRALVNTDTNVILEASVEYRSMN